MMRRALAGKPRPTTAPARLVGTQRRATLLRWAIVGFLVGLSGGLFGGLFGENVLSADGAAASPATDKPDAAVARRLLLTGKYAEAAEHYAPLAAKDPAAAIGLARAKAAVGREDEAVGALIAVGSHADVHAERALLAWRRGDRAEATAQVDAALRRRDDQLLARYLRGLLLEESGRYGEAEKAYRHLIDYYNAHEVSEAESLRWIGLAAARYARSSRAHDQFDFLVNELYPDALKREPLYWPARYEAGLLFQEKYNESEALRQFQEALAINPNAAEVHAAMAQLALTHRRIEAAESSLARARAIHPDLPETELAASALAWANFDDARAADLLQKKVLVRRPGWAPAMGRLAAVYVLRDGPTFEAATSKFHAIRKQATAYNPAPAEFYMALGESLEDRSKLPLAERFLQEAQRCSPKMIGPATLRGLAAMRMGEESRARQLLREALDADPFHVRVKNSLEVLSLLDTYATVDGKHVVLKFDPKHDGILARYAAKYLDEVYPRLCAELGFRPAKKPIVEIFNVARGNSGHHWFGARMVGLPYLGAVAASTGYIVGVTSPNDGGTRSRYNWARVLRHELAHVITLQHTDFNMPHWLTEGLAVRVEACPRPSQWNRLLSDRVPSRELLSLATINFAFTRPASSDQWQLAYCQSQLYVEYMLAQYGRDVPAKLSAAYAENLATPEAIRKATGVAVNAFEAGYVDFLVQTAKQLPAEPWNVRQKASELEAARKAKPNDASVGARLAYVRMLRGEDAPAAASARAALAVDAGNLMAKYVLARMLARNGKTAEALAQLKGCLDAKQPNLKVLQLQAGLLLKSGRHAEAKTLYAQAAAIDPLNPQWIQSQLRVCVATKDDAAAAPLLEMLADMEPDDVAARKKLIALCLARKNLAGAEKWANQAIQIDVKDGELHRLFAETWLAGNNLPQAVEELEIAVELEPTSAEALVALAQTQLRLGHAAEARKAVDTLARAHPNHPKVGELNRRLNTKDSP